MSVIVLVKWSKYETRTGKILVKPVTVTQMTAPEVPHDYGEVATALLRDMRPSCAEGESEVIQISIANIR